MPRRPRRHHLSPRPVAFSSYGRSLTRIATAYALKHQICGPKFQENPLRKCLGNEIPDQLLDGNDHESESSDEEVSEEEVQADFAFFDPKPDDFHGVKLLLQPYLDDKEWDISSFVDLVLAQPTVGTIVKLENDEDNGSFAVVTALNLGRHKGSKCIMEVKDYLLKACREGAIANKLKVLLEDKAEHVGLLVSQRVMNLPLQLLPHLYDALFDEISWATEDEPTEELRKSFRFKHYLLISRIYKKKAKSRKTSLDKSDNDIIYIKAEDELLIELSSWSFTFPLQSQQPADQELKNYQLCGLVMAVEAEKVPAFRKRLRSQIDES